MFVQNSRYYAVATTETAHPDGKTVIALKLRRLPRELGDPHTVKDTDQLDQLALQHYADGTKYWHIADANPALEATTLVGEVGAVIQKPQS